MNSAYKQPTPGFELGSPIPFLLMITLTLNRTSYYTNKDDKLLFPRNAFWLD